MHPELGFYFGYVMHSGASSWWIEAAPYLADAALMCLAVFLLTRYRFADGWRRVLWFFGLVSPLADLAYNYQGGLWRAGTDVADLLASAPAAAVHALFMAALLAGILVVRRHRPQQMA